MNRKRIWGLVPLLALALPLLAQNTPNPAKGYRSGKALLKQPFLMEGNVLRLCGNLTPEEQAKFDSDPHFHHYAQVYVNPTGQALAGRYTQALKTYEAKLRQLEKKNYRAYWKLYGQYEEKFFPKLPSFPVGTVLVKEKLDNPKGTGTPELLTAMVKREKGYNPACYDWEFLVLDGKAERILEHGKLARCQSCHAEKLYKRTEGVATFNLRMMPLAVFGSR
ncbi:hypothetical protein [Armatimonas sp.]|uniref:hypothetical protein n=1 Tax=Armatimonas sp. TaxID=1872638 RepID=UPI00286D42B6|nr:hypothetical protein [Armatimonas sp.]